MTTKSRTEQIRQYTYPVVNMGKHLREMEKILSGFEQQDMVNRIWHKDFTVWKTDPREITDRLGWLQIPDIMAGKINELEYFAREVRDAGFHHVVLLGMGGSSLGPEVLKQTFGSGAGYPPLIVLDSTNPAWIESVARNIEVKHTLFLVSSKSGTTIETVSLYKHFSNLAGSPSNFVAITDPGTPLARLAATAGFRRIFINPPDIGGRFSVLSYFGLLPAALTGIDVRALINRAIKMQENCAPCITVFENPGLWLGALICALANHGHNKLTLISSPSIRSFGLWLEQLLAESTGKEGKGIIPIIDEPILELKYYSDDRAFIYLRMKGDDNVETDEAVMRLEVADQPIIQLEIDDQYDLGAEFFRWEMATAVAGAVLGINPFDQPDVHSAKDSTRQVLHELQSSHRLPRINAVSNLKEWLDKARPGEYLAIMAYLNQTPAFERALFKLRKSISEKYFIATTFGYGPRLLHSAGQLHKGGPDEGLFLQIISNRKKDIRIPGESYGFGTLTEAEAQGDYRALEARGKRVARVELCSASGAAIERLLQDLDV